MRLTEYLNEGKNISTGLGADGITKAKLKSKIYKETKKHTHNKLYKDTYWEGPQKIWNTFNNLNLNWNFSKNSEYKYDKKISKMPVRKEWYFEIMWEGPNGKQMKQGGYLIAAGAGSVDDPLDKYDLVLVLF